jgi:iron complex outermembrane recepter protein
MRQIFIAAFMLLSAITAFGQHTIKGKVLDEKGNPLAGAIIIIQNNPQVQTSVKDGSFHFENLKNEHYTLVASFVGYETLKLKVTVDQNLTINLVQRSNSLQEITVTSLRASDKSPVAYSNLSKETLSKTNLGQDIPYLLSQTPSFVASSDAGTGIGYTNFRIRGTDASRINVTINGIPYNDADEQGAYWVDLPDFASSVESVQVQRGVGTSTNGAGAFGANINLQTDNYAQKASGELNLSGGSFNTLKETAKASSGLLNGHWAIDTRLSSVKSDGYIDRGWVDMKSYFVQAGYYAEKTTIKFLTFGGTEKTYHAWDGIDSYTLPILEYPRTYNPCGYMGVDANGNPLYYKNQTDNYTQTNYQLLGVHVFSPELSMNAGLHYTRGDGYYEEYKRNSSSSPVNLIEYSLKTFVVNGATVDQTDLVRQKKMGNDFAGGVFSFNYQKNKLNAQFGGTLNSYRGKHWGEVIWVKNYIGNLLPNSEYYRSKVTKWDGNIYLKANYELLPKLNIYADLQYRKVTYRLQGTNDQWDNSIGAMQVLNVDKKFDFFNPKAGLFYQPNKNNDLFASIAIAHREPTRTNYTNGSASTWPKPETLYDTEFGYKYHNAVCSFGANVYYMNYHNQLVLTGKINDIGEALTENISSSFRSGIELVGSIKPLNCLRWDVSATFSRNRITDFAETVNIVDENWIPTGQSVTNLYQSTPIAFTPDVLANSMITFTKGNFEAGLQSVYVGKQYVDNTGLNDRRLPDYFVNNLRLSYSLPVKGIRGVDFTVLVNNLFNEMYISNAWSAPTIAANPANPVYDKNSPVNNYFGCYPQAGINFLAGITLKF